MPWPGLNKKSIRKNQNNRGSLYVNSAGPPKLQLWPQRRHLKGICSKAKVNNCRSSQSGNRLTIFDNPTGIGLVSASGTRWGARQGVE